MKREDWKRLRNVLEAPDTAMLQKIIGAATHDEAHSLDHGLARETVRAIRRLADELGAASAADYASQFEELEAGYQEVKGKMASLVAENEDLKATINLGQECASAPLIRIPKRKGLKGKHFAEAHAMYSDPHAGLDVRPDSVLGLNEYNLAVCQERHAMWADRVIRLVKLHQQHREIRDLVIWSLGDNVNNEMHGGDGATSCLLGPMEACVWITGLKVVTIQRIAKELPGVKIRVVVLPGNHDRTTQKMEAGRAFAVSYTHAIGYGLRVQLEGVAEVTAPRATMMVLEMGSGMRIRGMHGHQFKYNKGIGGPEVGIRRALPRLNRGVSADVTVMGHFHSMSTPGDVLINGSICGTTPYALDGTFEPRDPEQIFFLTDSHYGLSAIHRIPLIA